MENCHGDEEEEEEARPSSNMKKKTKKRKRKWVPEDELKLLNDLTAFPYLSAMFQPQSLLLLKKREKISRPASETAARPQTIIVSIQQQEQEQLPTCVPLSQDAGKSRCNSLTLADVGSKRPIIGKKQQEKSRLQESIAKIRQWIKEKTGNSNDNSEEPKACNKKKKRRRRKSMPDDDLELLNDLSGFPHLAIAFQAHSVLRKRKKMNGHEMHSLESRMQPQTIGDSEAKGQQEESKSSESISQMPGGQKEIMDNGNGNNKEQGSGNRKKKKRNREPDEELKILNDLTGYPHVATMLQGEKLFRETKVLRRENINIPENNSAENGIQSQATRRVDAPREDCTEGAYELLQTHKNADTLEVVDLPSSSPQQDEALDFWDLGGSSSSDDVNTEEREEKSSPDECVGAAEDASLPSAEDIFPMMLLVDAEDGDRCKDVGDGERCKEVSKYVSIESKSAITEENPVLRKLLRRWRYFDPEDESFHLGGRAVKSFAKSRRKPCYICGDVQHTANRCRKRRTCFVCEERGHIAKDCPKSSQEFDICLRCRESGHDLFSCNNDYPPDDLKKILCYVCNESGHICCCSYTNISPETVSCYNCGESGHSGLQCPKPHMDKKSSRPPLICYKCGEEGHAARKCGVLPVQNKHRQSKDCSTKSNSISNE